MPSPVELIAALDELLDAHAFDDYAPNGLQVAGGRDVAVVATGVSAQLELFEQAVAAGAQLLLVHHGLFWDGDARVVDGPLKRRLQLLLDHDVALAAYHLPLDAHPEHGNNALLAAAIGAAKRAPFADHHGRAIGVHARFAQDGVEPSELRRRVAAATGREPLHFACGPDRVRSIGIVSGAGSGYLGDAIDAGLDAFVTGEPTERVMAQAREAGIHFLAAGHYATETFGVRRLGELLADRFGVDHVFLDIPNPI